VASARIRNLLFNAGARRRGSLRPEAKLLHKHSVRGSCSPQMLRSFTSFAHNRRLSAPGRRTDLRKGAPAGLTWTAWVQSKRKKLGRSLRSVQRLLSGKTEASQKRQSQPRATVAQGSVDASEIPANPMEVAAEMARLVLEMRKGSRNAGSNKHRLELLAEHFLRITGQVTMGRTTSIARIGSTDTESGWRM
jgi:hypothetical protein